jgi:hypothetical protein
MSKGCENYECGYLAGRRGRRRVRRADRDGIVCRSRGGQPGGGDVSGCFLAAGQAGAQRFLWRLHRDRRRRRARRVGVRRFLRADRLGAQRVLVDQGAVSPAWPGRRSSRRARPRPAMSGRSLTAATPGRCGGTGTPGASSAPSPGRSAGRSSPARPTCGCSGSLTSQGGGLGALAFPGAKGGPLRRATSTRCQPWPAGQPDLDAAAFPACCVPAVLPGRGPGAG